MGSVSSLHPFHQSVIPEINETETGEILRCLAGIVKSTTFPNEEGKEAEAIAAAIESKLQELKIHNGEVFEYCMNVINRLRQGTLGRKPAHESICCAVTHVKATEASAKHLLRALGKLIKNTVIPEGQELIQKAFVKKANLSGIWPTDETFCMSVWNSLEAQASVAA